MPHLRRPPKLEAGDCVGIAAPALPYYRAMEPFLNLGMSALQRLGLRTKLARHALHERKQLAVSAEARASDLNDLFADSEVKAIICLAGGANVNAVLPLLDWSAIKRSPKIVMGYSANTSLLLGLHAKTGLITFHGPHVLDGFSEYPEPLPYTIGHLRRLLFESSPVGPLSPPHAWTTAFPQVDSPRPMKPNPGWRWLKPGKATGRLIGGNLDTMRTLAGTDYWPSFRSAILFVEEVYMGAPMLHRIDESLTHLKLLGLFSQVQGLVVGKVNDLSPHDEELLAELLHEHTEGHDFPVLTQVDLGHTDPKLTLPIGIRATLDSSRNLFSLDDPAVC